MKNFVLHFQAKKNLKKFKISLNSSNIIKVFFEIIPYIEKANINRYLVKMSSIYILHIYLCYTIYSIFIKYIG